MADTTVATATDYALEVETVQAKEFKTLFEALKDILTDAEIIFDDQGMRITAMEKNTIVLVHLRLLAEKFQTYKCKKVFKVGVDMQDLHKIIKTLGNNETLTIYIKNMDDDRIWFKFHNSELNKIVKICMTMKDIDGDQIEIPAMSFESVITMPSGEFQKICKNYSNFSDYLGIKSCGNTTSLYCTDKNNGNTIETTYVNEVAPDETSEEVVQGYYMLKYLVSFSKCADLGESFKINMKNDFPLVLTFSIGSLGQLLVLLSPHDTSV